MEMQMNTCKTCQHWKPVEIDSWYSAVGKAHGGHCQSEKLTEHSGYGNDMLVYAYDEGAGEIAFWTGTDFGCVHHKVK